MPDFSWKWFWSKVFDEFEARDYFVFLAALGFFLLVWGGRIHSEHIDKILGVIVGYALGRPNMRRGGEDK